MKPAIVLIVVFASAANAALNATQKQILIVTTSAQHIPHTAHTAHTAHCSHIAYTAQSAQSAERVSDLRILSFR